jgi:hypothetical protein
MTETISPTGGNQHNPGRDCRKERERGTVGGAMMTCQQQVGIQ